MQLQRNKAQIWSSLCTEMREEAKSFSERLLNNRFFFLCVCVELHIIKKHFVAEV